MDKRLIGFVLASAYLMAALIVAVHTPPENTNMVLKWCIGVPLTNCCIAYMLWRMYGN